MVLPRLAGRKSVPFCVRLYWNLARLTADYQPNQTLVVLSANRTPMTNRILPDASPHSLHIFKAAYTADNLRPLRMTARIDFKAAYTADNM